MRGDWKAPDITLVNPRPKFVERIRLHQLVAGNYDATVDYGSLLGSGIKLVVDTATRIDTANRTVELASGRCAGLRLRHLRGRQHRRRTGVRARRSRIRLSHRRTGAGAAPAHRHRRPASGRTGDRRRRRADRHRDGHRVRRAGTQRHVGLRRSAGAVPVRAGTSLGRQGAAQAGRQDAGGRRGRPRCDPMPSSSPTAPCARARSPSGPPASACRALRRPADCAPTRSAGCSPTRPSRVVDDDASSPPVTAHRPRVSRCGCAARRPHSWGRRPPTPC